MSPKKPDDGVTGREGFLEMDERDAESAEADLGKDALAGEDLGGEANHETEHGQAAIPGFREGNEAETGSCFSHGSQLVA